uniref:Uncharacterized protein n=1 Tax=Oryza nivara TaxID=4536 RepID=A0A0E0GHH1_ORYNI
MEPQLNNSPKFRSKQTTIKPKREAFRSTREAEFEAKKKKEQRGRGCSYLCSPTTRQWEQRARTVALVARGKRVTKTSALLDAGRDEELVGSRDRVEAELPMAEERGIQR